MATSYTASGKQLLFVYGTLQDPEVQQILFGSTLEMQAAKLPDWVICSADDNGYLFIRPEPGGMVCGSIISLAAHNLAVADQWEETPLYQRERVTVITDKPNNLEAWAYTRRNGKGAVYTGDRPSLHDRQAMLNEATQFRQLLS